jgi:hypothetical protein
LKSYRDSFNNNKIEKVFNEIIEFYDELEVKKNDEEIKKKLFDYLNKIIPQLTKENEGNEEGIN